MRLALPAPFPGYAIALFIPLTILPFGVAAWIWCAVCVAATVACVVLTSRIAGIPLLPVMWAFLLPALCFWIPYGEVMPVALAGVLFAAWMLQQGGYNAAAAGLAVAAVLPSLALAPWLSCILLVPRMRTPLIAAGVVLCGVWAATGPALAVEYVAAVLPLHALAELPRLSQYSLSWLLRAAGADNALALRAGTLAFVVLLAAGIAAAAILGRKWREPAAILIVPLAAGVMGGTFVHGGEVVAALPLGFLLLSRAASIRALSALGILAIALPWYVFRFEFALVPAAILAAGCIAGSLRNPIWGMRAAAVVALALGAILFVQSHDVTVLPGASVPAALSSNLIDASASWGREIWTNESAVTLSALLAKLPVWTGMLSLISGVAVLFHEKLNAGVGVDQAPIAL
jgi:hypothetical protein